jgi:hypothetical protein
MTLASPIPTNDTGLVDMTSREVMGGLGRKRPACP